MTLANFKLLGTIPVENDLQGFRHYYTISNLKILIGILKGPVALLEFKSEISVSILPTVAGKRKKLLHSGLFKYSIGDVEPLGI
jgi:hypothetical protein